MGNLNTAAGARLFIGTQQAASVQADYETDSFTEVGQVSDLGQFGDQATEVTFSTLADSRLRRFKGQLDAGTMTVVAGYDGLDDGQAAMRAAAEDRSKLDYNFKVVLNDAVTVNGVPSIIYFHGKVMSKQLNVGNVGNVVTDTFKVGINSDFVVVDPT